MHDLLGSVDLGTSLIVESLNSCPTCISNPSKTYPGESCGFQCSPYQCLSNVESITTATAPSSHVISTMRR
jgi:hypothetical protein